MLQPMTPNLRANRENHAKVTRLVYEATQDAAIRKYWAMSSERVIYTMMALQSRGIIGKRLCELGPGGLGLACAKTLGCEVTAFDCVDEFFVPIYRKNQVPVHFIDLNQTALVAKAEFDFIVFCEVIEHLARWPLDTLSELYQSLAPNGTLLLTTQNLLRLSNRLRLARGRPIFVNFTPEDMVMGHMREYCLEELEFLLKRSGFIDIQVEHVTFSDQEASWLVRRSYEGLCGMFPRLSNFLIAWARKPAL